VPVHELRQPVRDPLIGVAGSSLVAQRSAHVVVPPTDDDQAQEVDTAYVARHQIDGRVIVHIAGIHGIGSLGATHYLTTHLADLFRETGDQSFSLAVRASYDGLTITGSELAAGPYVW
jgi:hypothetical protein